MNSLLGIIKETESEKEVKRYIDFFVQENTRVSRDINEDNYLGIKADVNPHFNVVRNTDDLNGDISSFNGRWKGYIPKDVKVSYKISATKGVRYNDCFYFMGDESYLYEFAKFIKDKKVGSEIAFIFHVYDFIRSYFDRSINPVDREKYHTLIYDHLGRRMISKRKNYLSDLKGLGAALCTEYSVMGQNIMSLFGLTTEVVYDKNHVYNVFFADDGEVMIVDFQWFINMYDINNKFKRTLPFVEPIENFSKEMYLKMIAGIEKFRFENYFVVDFPGELIAFRDGGIRSYGSVGLDLTKFASQEDLKKLLKSNK